MNANYEQAFQSLLHLRTTYKGALNEMLDQMAMIDQSTRNRCLDFLANKIFSNDNFIELIDELKKLNEYGYEFNPTMINKLMDHCVNNYDTEFHKFVRMKIVNPLTKVELDKLNVDILNKFVQRFLVHHQQLRIGLSKKRLAKFEDDSQMKINKLK